MVEGGLGVASRGGQQIGSPRFARRQTADLLGSLETVAAQLAADQRPARLAADAAAAALGASTIAVALPDGAGQLRAEHVRGLPDHARGALAEALRYAPWLAGRRLPGAPELTGVPIPLTGGRSGVMLVGRGRLLPDERAYLTVLAALLGLALQREPPASPHLRVGDLDIDLGEQRVVAGDRDARLTPSEIRLLLYLAEDPGRPRTRREILRHLWRTEHVVDERACDVHISNLRRKIERDPSRPQRLVTVRSVGYALQPM